MPKKIDPLNRKLYGAVTVMLTVNDIKAAANFYQNAFGFAKRGIMNGPDGKPMHAELRLRDTTLMLGPECAERGMRSAKTIGGWTVTQTERGWTWTSPLGLSYTTAPHDYRLGP